MHQAVLINHRIALGSEGAAQRDLGIEWTALVEVDNAQPIGAFDLAAGGRNLAEQKFQQTGFAAAVRTYQSDSQACGNHKI